MQPLAPRDAQKLARIVGAALLATLFIGIAGALTVAKGIDINLSADVRATAENMLEAESQLRAKAYLAALLFGIGILVSAGLFLLLRHAGPLLAWWSLLTGIGASFLSLLGAMFALNAAEIAGNEAFGVLANESQRLLLTGLQVTSDYTSFHLSLVISSVSMAGFFTLFLMSNRIPKIIAGWGVFASLFVAIAIVARDFIPLIGHNSITMAFMLSNLIALISTGLYLLIRGVRSA